jgi:L-threonylcarbamoyladenylate synthase
VDQLGDRVAVYLDGGPLGTEVDGAEPDSAARTALPSTIVDFTRHDDGQILRRGALDLETLRRVLPGLRDLEEPASTVAHAMEPPPAPEPEPAAPEPAPAVEPEPPAPQPSAPPQPDEPRVEPEPTA